jgi:hypothetical protein
LMILSIIRSIAMVLAPTPKRPVFPILSILY